MLSDRTRASRLAAPGRTLVLLGSTQEEFGGSIAQQECGGGLTGMPPVIDLGNEARLGELLSGYAVADSTVRAAHDLSEGGLAQSLVELALFSGVGVTASLDEVHPDAFTALFSESASRIVVAVDESEVEAFLARAAEVGVPAVVLGSTGGEAVVISGANLSQEIVLSIDELREAWEGTLPGIFGHAVGANSVVE